MDQGNIMKDMGTVPVTQVSRYRIISGSALLLLAAAAFSLPMFAGSRVTVLTGLLLAASGIIEIAWSAKAGPFGRGTLSLLFGVTLTFTGLLIMATPVDCPGIVKDVLVVFFVAGSVLPIMALGQRSHDGFAWKVVGGIASMLLAGLLASRWPLSGATAVCIYAGIRIALHGCMQIALGASERGRRDLLADRIGMLLAVDGELRDKTLDPEIDPAVRGLHRKLDEAREILLEATAASGGANPTPSARIENGVRRKRTLVFYAVAIAVLVSLCLAAVLWPRLANGKSGDAGEGNGWEEHLDCN
jgi:uncharacterized membrane protein HdeD (DUF308 family)